MTTAIAINESHAIQAGQLNREQIELLKTTICRDTTDDELKLFLEVCRSTGLDPFQKQIHAVKRWNNTAQKHEMQIQIGIDGFRIQSERSGKYAGQVGPFWCGSDGAWKDVWLSDEPPMAAKVGVMRQDFKEPLYAIALYAEYVQTKKDGTPNSTWQNRPAGQLAKCAESLARRTAFPETLSGLYSAEEMGQADNEMPLSAPPKQTIAPVVVAQARLIAAPAPPLPPRPWSNFAGMIHCFQEQRERVGDVPYYEMLKCAGVEHANGFKATEAAIVCFAKLDKLPSHAPREVAVIEAEVIDAAQEPEPKTELGKHLAKGKK